MKTVTTLLAGLLLATHAGATSKSGLEYKALKSHIEITRKLIDASAGNLTQAGKLDEIKAALSQAESAVTKKQLRQAKSNLDRAMSTLFMAREQLSPETVAESEAVNKQYPLFAVLGSYNRVREIEADPKKLDAVIEQARKTQKEKNMKKENAPFVFLDSPHWVYVDAGADLTKPESQMLGPLAWDYPELVVTVFSELAKAETWPASKEDSVADSIFKRRMSSLTVPMIFAKVPNMNMKAAEFFAQHESFFSTDRPLLPKNPSKVTITDPKVRGPQLLNEMEVLEKQVAFINNVKPTAWCGQIKGFVKSLQTMTEAPYTGLAIKRFVQEKTGCPLNVVSFKEMSEDLKKYDQKTKLNIEATRKIVDFVSDDLKRLKRWNEIHAALSKAEEAFSKGATVESNLHLDHAMATLFSVHQVLAPNSQGKTAGAFHADYPIIRALNILHQLIQDEADVNKRGATSDQCRERLTWIQKHPPSEILVFTCVAATLSEKYNAALSELADQYSELVGALLIQIEKDERWPESLGETPPNLIFNYRISQLGAPKKSINKFSTQSDLSDSVAYLKVYGFMRKDLTKEELRSKDAQTLKLHINGYLLDIGAEADLLRGLTKKQWCSNVQNFLTSADKQIGERDKEKAPLLRSYAAQIEAIALNNAGCPRPIFVSQRKNGHRATEKTATRSVSSVE